MRTATGLGRTGIVATLAAGTAGFGGPALASEPEVVRYGQTTVVLTDRGAEVATRLGTGARLLARGTDGVTVELGVEGRGSGERDMVFIDRGLTDDELASIGVTDVSAWAPIAMSTAQDGGVVRGNPFRPEIGRGTSTNRPSRSGTGTSTGFTFTPGVGHGPYYPVYDKPYYPYFYWNNGLYLYGSTGARIDRYGSTAPLGTRYYQGPINGLVSGTPVIIAGDGSMTLTTPAPPPPPSPIEVATRELQVEKPGSAAATLERALREDPADGDEQTQDASAPAWDRAEARRLLGIAKLLEGEMGDGIALVRQAYADDPGLCDRPLDHAAFLRPSQMTDLVKRAVGEAHNRDSASSWFVVVVLMQSEGRDARALKIMDRADAAFLDAALSERMRGALQ